MVKLDGRFAVFTFGPAMTRLCKLFTRRSRDSSRPGTARTRYAPWGRPPDPPYSGRAPRAWAALATPAPPGLPAGTAGPRREGLM